MSIIISLKIQKIHLCRLVCNSDKSFKVGDFAKIEYKDTKGHIWGTDTKEILSITRKHVLFKAKTNNFIENEISHLEFCRTNFSSEIKKHHIYISSSSIN